MQGTYDPILVALSILIAALAGYVAIEFAGRLFSRRDQWMKWLAGGSLAMGSGIWAMHFVGMSAFSLPIAVSYDLGITVLSWLAAVAVSALALAIVSRGTLTAAKVVVGALAMGAGICVMHYSGMGAMRMDPGIGYDPLWFAVSVLIAVGASAAALLCTVDLLVFRALPGAVKSCNCPLGTLRRGTSHQPGSRRAWLTWPSKCTRSPPRRPAPGPFRRRSVLRGAWGRSRPPQNRRLRPPCPRSRTSRRWAAPRPTCPV